MEILSKFYQAVFPYTGIVEWFYAFTGLLLFHLIKMKNVPASKFNWRIWTHFNLLPLFIAFVTTAICLGAIPFIIKDFSPLDAALIGYSSSSLLKQIFKNRTAIITKI